MIDIIDWPQEKIDALLKEYSDTEDIDVTLQNMGKRIEELEQELARYTGAEANEYGQTQQRMAELLKENERLRKQVQE